MRLRNFSILGDVPALALVLLLSGCAAPAPRVLTVTQASAVAYPARPAFTELHNGDVARMDYAARMRLGQRHTETVWYMRELENALKAYDAQTALPSRGMGGSAGGISPPVRNNDAQTVPATAEGTRP